MSAITIRPYRPDDVAALIGLFRRAVREIAVRDYTQMQVRAWAPDAIDHTAFARRRESKSTWIAELAGTIAGFSDLEPDGHIDSFTSILSFRGAVSPRRSLPISSGTPEARV